MKGDYEVINRLLNETMHMDFPFLASEDKKKRIVEDKKIYIEDTIRSKQIYVLFYIRTHNDV